MALILKPFTFFKDEKNCINCGNKIKTRKYIFSSYACSMKCESELMDKSWKAYMDEQSKPKVYCKECGKVKI